MKRKVIILVIAVVLLLVLLPFPQRVEQTYYGVNTASGEKVSISANMHYFRFLILKDKLRGKVTVTQGNQSVIYGEHLHYQGLWPSNNEDKTFHALVGWRYADETKEGKPIGFEPAHIYLSRDFSKVLIGETRDDGKSQYVGNTEENRTEETLVYFVGYTNE